MMILSWDTKTARWLSRTSNNSLPIRLGRDAVVVAQDGRCILMVRKDDAMVNGVRAMPLCILNHKDELRVGETVFYFSVESESKPVPFDGDVQIFCARCKGEIKKREMSVRCRCGAWFHQTDTMQCWTYDDRCSSCDQTTTGISWLPEPPARTKARQGPEHD